MVGKMFDPFRAGADARVKTSLGLGRDNVQQIAIAHGGSCHVTSDDEGTACKIAWPRVPIDVLTDRD
jgi:signal transduction histidine kinase